MTEFDAVLEEQVQLVHASIERAGRLTRWWNRGVIEAQIANANATLAMLLALRELHHDLVPATPEPPPVRPEAQW
jgi:hypothetical protein